MMKVDHGSYPRFKIRRSTLLATLMAALGLAGAGAAEHAQATTGPTPLAHRPRFEVTRAQVAPYLGKFRLSQPLGHGLRGGAYVAKYNEFGYPEGDLAVYAYDSEGKPSDWVGATYEYHALKGGMVIDVISPNNQVIFARMRLHRLPDGKLTGELKQLLPKGPAQRVTLTPVHAATGTSGATRGLATGATAPASGTGAQDQQAGIFSGVLRAAQQLTGSSGG